MLLTDLSELHFIGYKTYIHTGDPETRIESFWHFSLENQDAVNF